MTTIDNIRFPQAQQRVVFVRERLSLREWCGRAFFVFLGLMLLIMQAKLWGVS